jgi:hypothetical protein
MKFLKKILNIIGASLFIILLWAFIGFVVYVWLRITLSH